MSENSRLYINSAQLRNDIEARNIYTPDVEYPLTPTTTQSIVNTISSITSALMPFSGYNLKASTIGRLASPTPLTIVSTALLATQWGYNSMAHLAQQTFPKINLNLLDIIKGGKMFQENINYSITKKAQSKLANLIDKLVYTNPNKNNPFDTDPTNADYIINTGAGQFGQFISAINKNLYKQNDDDASSNLLSTYALKAGTQVMPRSVVLGGKDGKIGQGKDDKTFFTFNNRKFNAYLSFGFDVNSVQKITNSIENANMVMINSYNYTDGITSDYAPSRGFIEENFGRTDNSKSRMSFQDNSQNSWINDDKVFPDDDIDNRIMWGRDGITNSVNDKMSPLRGNFGDFGEVIYSPAPTNLQSFNIKGGLLEYTRNLVNATNGVIGDLTRKAFTSEGNVDGFNGSALWKANTSEYAKKRSIDGKTGQRQHSAVDQYDRFAKAIRFNGNSVYGGNKDSVIYNSVLPRIHPTLNPDKTINNKNMMFSIENLAVRVISKDTYGIIDDEYGSPIPACEVGPFNGRIMWFPPYNLEIQETAQAKYESTVMIGRNEPMYNYQNSERGATLSFTLLVDYPPQLKNYISSTGRQREISEFFAFGGDKFTDAFVDIENIQIRIEKLKGDIKETEGPTTPAVPDDIPTSKIRVVFPNDVPTVSDNVNTIIDDLYNKYTYEILGGLPSSDVKSWGLNRQIFHLSGVTSTDTGEWKLDKRKVYPQYSQVTEDQFGTKGELNDNLYKVFNDPKNRPYYGVYIHGGASKLYTPTIATDTAAGSTYNKALGERRAKAVQNLVKERLKAMFGDSVANGINVEWDTVLGESVGDVQANASNATIAAIPDYDTKNERFAIIEIKKNGKVPEPIKPSTSITDDGDIIKIKKEIETLEKKIVTIKSNLSCIYNERGSLDTDGAGKTAILQGFDSVSGNYYYPVFHSQTPEDFHKRLTFLHQCTRQGSAKRYSDTDANGELRARNSVFGRQPICILRVGDFFYTKVVIENYTIDYSDTTWDMNPEGFGMQPMLAKVTLQMKLIGGQSLKGPIDALQNAVSFNYYANSSFSSDGMYKLPSKIADDQESYIGGILTAEQGALKSNYAAGIKSGTIKSTVSNAQ